MFNFLIGSNQLCFGLLLTEWSDKTITRDVITEEDDVIGDAVEEAVRDGEDGDRGVEAEEGGEGGQGPQQAAEYQTGAVTK